MLGDTARSQEDGQRREAGREASRPAREARERMMGFEPTTFAMARRRSSQLSYIRVERRV